MIPIMIKHSDDNSTQLVIGNLELWFSYRTVIAFRFCDVLRVSENLWGATTGKHLNWIDNGNKKSRMKRDEFEKDLDKVLSICGFREG